MINSLLLLAFFLSTPILEAESKTLFIGDSHSVGIFGKEFDSLLRDSEKSVITHTSCGAVANIQQIQPALFLRCPL